jgi:NADPH:quinone reductase-like Zn-dependent oxidoreductase
MSVIQTQVFEVEKTQIQNSRITTFELNSNKTTLAENDVILKIDKFALTANNITYAIAGDTLGYWRFFPAENNWGRIPAMGFAEVIVSNCPNISVGERVWGFVPMASHVKIKVGKINNMSFSDISAHREGLSPLYSTFERVQNNPFYQPENEDYEMLVKGLFTTAWLIDDFMFDQHYFAAKQYLITSASSKTSIALAFAIKQRGEQQSIGITSKRNQQFVEQLGCYNQVICYDDILSLDNNVPSILVDMAGSQTTLNTIHQHFQQQLRYSCRVGATHHSDLIADALNTDQHLPGAKPVFFFAPTQMKKRTIDWGVAKTMQQIGRGLLSYIEFCRPNIHIKHSLGGTQIDTVYQQVLSGKADASVGHILSF